MIRIGPVMTHRSCLYLPERLVTASPSTLARALLYQDAIDSQAFKVGPKDTT
jgi:hypothetical protein